MIGYLLKTLTDMKNSASDISCVSGQMPRIVGLGYASKLYRENKNLSNMPNFSINGNEVIFGTIGDASTSEGHFWESINACGVLQIPVIMSIWDDGYGISVPSEYHTTRNDLSKVASQYAENAKISIRNVRREGMDELKFEEKETGGGENGRGRHGRERDR